MLRAKYLFYLLLLLIGSGLLGLLLLIIMYCMPTEKIRDNIKRGAYIYLQESAEFEYAEGYTSAILDNYTDSLILSKVVYPSKNPILDAINVPSYNKSDSAEGMSLFSYLNNTTGEPMDTQNYARYWHGYQVILRPFFIFFDFADLVIFNQIFQMLILATVVYLLCRNGLVKYLPAFGVMIFFWNMASMGMSLQYSPCFYISMISSAIILARNTEDNNKTIKNTLKYDSFFDSAIFLFTGISVAYFDFLTYPLVTLGVPLVMWTLNYRTRYTNRFFTLFRLSICWVIGYLGMWSEKWILGSLLTQNNVVLNAIESIMQRTSTQIDETSIARREIAIYLVKRSLLKWPYVFLLVIVVILVLIYWQKRRTFGDWIQSFRLFFIGCLPFAWYFITANHSYVHPRLTYRILGITIFAWLSAMINLFLEKRKPIGGKNTSA